MFSRTHKSIFLLSRFKTIFLKKNKKDFLNSFFFLDSLDCIKMEDFPIHYRMALRLWEGKPQSRRKKFNKYIKYMTYQIHKGFYKWRKVRHKRGKGDETWTVDCQEQIIWWSKSFENLLNSQIIKINAI